MSPEEAKLFRLYGKLPNKKDLLQNKLKVSFHSTSAILGHGELTRLHRSASTSTAATMPFPRPAKPQTWASPKSAASTPTPKRSRTWPRPHQATGRFQQVETSRLAVRRRKVALSSTARRA